MAVFSMKALLRATLLSIGCVSAAFLGSCGTPGGHRAVTTEELEPFECGTVAKIHTLGGIFLASQPQPDDFKQAKQGGIKTVINLRKSSELPWDEAATVEALGLEYHAIPFASPAELSDGVLDSTRALLNDPARKPILLHCSSANRVGAIWLAHRMVDGGLSYEDAVAEARTVGLKLPAYEARAREYAEARKNR